MLNYQRVSATFVWCDLSLVSKTSTFATNPKPKNCPGMVPVSSSPFVRLQWLMTTISTGRSVKRWGPIAQTRTRHLHPVVCRIADQKATWIRLKESLVCFWVIPSKIENRTWKSMGSKIQFKAGDKINKTLPRLGPFSVRPKPFGKENWPGPRCHDHSMVFLPRYHHMGGQNFVVPQWLIRIL